MRPDIRIIERNPDEELPPGYTIQQITIPARKGPKPPKRTRAQAAREANEQLEKDVRRWTARAIAAGL